MELERQICKLICQMHKNHYKDKYSGLFKIMFYNSIPSSYGSLITAVRFECVHILRKVYGDNAFSLFHTLIFHSITLSRLKQIKALKIAQR